MRQYYKYSKFSFGMYNDYEVGLVFVVDPGYIEWCILNISGFCLTDLNELLKGGFVKQVKDQWANRRVGEPEYNIHFEAYDSYDHITQEVMMSTDYYDFSDEAINLNNSRI
jgi:hypothetical protein